VGAWGSAEVKCILEQKGKEVPPYEQPKERSTTMPSEGWERNPVQWFTQQPEQRRRVSGPKENGKGSRFVRKFVNWAAATQRRPPQVQGGPQTDRARVRGQLHAHGPNKRKKK